LRWQRHNLTLVPVPLAEREASARRFFPIRISRTIVMQRIAMLMLAGALLGCVTAQAQPLVPPPAQGSSCPPDVKQDAPTVGRDSDKSLSDQLAASKGVICPPAGVDPQMQKAPPEGGAMKVIPPPGSPGGNPSIQPK
jgi:hypothetical protein